MNDIVKFADVQLKDRIIDAIRAAQADGSLPDAGIPEFRIEVPADRAHGDRSANAAMAGARLYRQAPPAIAAKILAHLDLTDSCFDTAEAVGGFLNFTFGPGYYADVLGQVTQQGDAFGSSDLGKGKKALVEFVSANPTGPMHIGNARGGAMGDTLAEILTRAGYHTEREFYINDAGNQIEKFGLSLDIRYRQKYGEDVELPEDSYHGQDIVDHVNAFAEVYGDQYIGEDEQTRRKALVAFALPKNIEGLERDLLKYGIRYDTWFRESSLYAKNAPAQVVETLTARGYTYEQDGAVWFRAEQFGCDKDFVLRRSNGLFTYIVPDIAYHFNKLSTRGFDLAVDILGADHHGYVPRLKAALTAMGVDADKLKVVLMQMVRLVRDGEVIKLSKRSGKAITLVTLLDEVPIDAARFFFNLREANTPIDFDLDLAVEESSKNPVYYCQYAHARICSIFRNMQEKGIAWDGCTREQAMKLTAEEEKALINHIGSLRGEIEQAAEALDPSRITRYAVELATLFHKFYNACRVGVDDADLRAARLYLCDCTRSVMRNVLAMMKISAPEMM